MPTGPPPTDLCDTSSCIESPLGNMSGGVFLFLIGDLPAIIGVLMISCCTWCCAKYRRDKKAHKQWQMDAADREAEGEPPLEPSQAGVRDIPTHLGGGIILHVCPPPEEQLIVNGKLSLTSMTVHYSLILRLFLVYKYSIDVLHHRSVVLPSQPSHKHKLGKPTTTATPPFE